jgi:hypothetical protein
VNGDLRVFDPEQSLEPEAANKRITQFLRVGIGLRPESGDDASGVAQRQAKGDVAHPDRGAKAARRAPRLIICCDAALAAIPNDLLDPFDPTTEKVNLPAPDRKPFAARNPSTPAADLGHNGGLRIVKQTLDRGKQARDLESVRGGASGASRPRSAERNRGHTANLRPFTRRKSLRVGGGRRLFVSARPASLRPSFARWGRKKTDRAVKKVSKGLSLGIL